MNELLEKEYELTLLTSGESVLSAIEKSFSNFQNLEIFHKEPAKLINLSYPIKKQSSAYFSFFRFRVLPEVIEKLKPTLEFDEGVLGTAQKLYKELATGFTAAFFSTRRHFMGREWLEKNNY